MTTTKKYFYYIEYRYNSLKRNNRELSIYRILNGKLSYVGNKKYTTGATRGAESEVFEFLVGKKLIPQKYFKASPCYYKSEVGKKYEIQQIS